jgi:transcriptional regulator GlxA family with amidase domain
MQIAILLYDRFTALDAVGPYEVLSRLPGAELSFVAAEARPYTTDTGHLTVVPERTIDAVPSPDVVLVPGGPGEDAMHDDRVLDWLRTAHETTTWTTSVCTGSLILARAGVLDGVRATSHWLAMKRLGELGAVPVGERIVEDGKVITAAGVSAGIDMALHLASRISGGDVAKFVQLFIEYDPQPPFDAGSPEKAPAELVQRARELSRFYAPVTN